MNKNVDNPFKFGSVVDAPHFTNRREELKQVKSILNSDVHLIIMSPRRYGKTSLIRKAVKEIGRPSILVDLQVITSEIDLAEQLLKKIYRLLPFEKLKKFLKDFRILPNVSINPVSDEVSITFETKLDSTIVLEDVLNLLNAVSKKGRRLIVVFDEFQSIRKIGKDSENILRSILQYHKEINYVFLGSQMSLMHDIFKDKNAPFYNFGYLFQLTKIERDEFRTFIEHGLSRLSAELQNVPEEILDITDAHPYFTQQLAFEVFEQVKLSGKTKGVVQMAFDHILQTHDMDYERFWNTFNSLDMKVLTGLAFSEDAPMSEKFIHKYRTGSSSSTYSAVQRLMKKGYVIKSDAGFQIDDPFFAGWIRKRRNG